MYNVKRDSVGWCVYSRVRFCHNDHHGWFRLKHPEDEHSAEQADEDGDEDDDDHKPVVKRRGKPKFMF